MTAKTKKPATLTITKATSQARRVADRIVPGAQIFIKSRGSWDLTTDEHLMITEISLPLGDNRAWPLAEALKAMDGFHSYEVVGSEVRVTRTV